MKKQLIYLLASACLLAAGCSTENKTDETGYGTLAINCTADTSIDTASAEASGTPEAPAAGAFSLTVTGETGTQKWDTLTEFEQSQTVFRMGAYTVAIAHGDPDAEGAGKPYYYAEQKIEVLPRRTVNADLTATVANSQVVIRATEQFLAYFHDARFTVTTASGNEFAFTPGSDPADEPVFVKGGTRLTVTGTARRQSPTGTGEGPEVTFSAQTLDATTPRTCHIITYDAKNAGSATLTITLGDSYTDTGRSTARSTREPSTIPKRNKNRERYENIYQISHDVSGCGTLRNRLCKRRAPVQGGSEPRARRDDRLSVDRQPLDDGRLRRNRNPSRRHVG